MKANIEVNTVIPVCYIMRAVQHWVYNTACWSSHDGVYCLMTKWLWRVTVHFGVNLH